MASPRFYHTEKTSRGNLLQESMSKGDMNPVMYGILKMVEYKVQMFHDFYTYLPGQLCKITKPFKWSKIQMWYILRF